MLLTTKVLMKYFIYKILTKSIRKLREFFFLRYNKFIFSLAGVRYGKKLRITNHLYIDIEQDSKISIGNNFIFTSGEAFNALSRNIKGCIHAKTNAQIIIGDNVGISSSCLWAESSIQIGNNVKIGGDCLIMDTDAHSLNYIYRRKYKDDIININSSPIIIEDDVLIGTRCIILKGVTIGKQSIIGSGSIVTKNIPPNCIAAGNPAKVIKQI